jgi:hypothetical protein
MARLLNMVVFALLLFCCNASVSAAAPTSGVENEIPEPEQKVTEFEVPLSANIDKLLGEKFNKIGYVKFDKVKVRQEPKKKSKILIMFKMNKKIKYHSYNKKWIKIKYKKGFAYIYKKDISKKKIKIKIYSVPKYSGYKSWMPYTAITSPSSPQYRLQHQYAYTGKYGIRMVNDRYCVAIGSYFKASIGQYFDLILANGTIIKCIKSDEKANRDTDSANIFSTNGCCSEFLIDRNSLAHSIRLSGDASSACKAWKSRVIKVRVYKKNILK